MEFLIALFLSLPAVLADSIMETHSFGWSGHQITAGQRKLQNWEFVGKDFTPQPISNKVIMTPPYPGNRQGGIWSEQPLHMPQWVAELEFRATGQEHAGGNINIWYTKENQAQIAAESVYTVSKFQGLAILIDQYGGPGGGIRAFLNDGSIDFRSHPHIEGKSFGHCDYSYRNLGRPSKLQIKQYSGGLEVTVDGRKCFRTDSVLLPSDYHFGITATSSETPDSFEVFSFITKTVPKGRTSPPSSGQSPGQSPNHEPVRWRGSYTPVEWDRDTVADAKASLFKGSDDQFSDVHNRLQSMSHRIDAMYRDMNLGIGVLQGTIDEIAHSNADAEMMGKVEARVAKLEGMLESLTKEIRGKHVEYTGHFNDVHAGIKARHDAMMVELADHVTGVVQRHKPAVGFFVFVIICMQVGLAGLYVWYKRRRSGSSKKLL